MLLRRMGRRDSPLTRDALQELRDARAHLDHQTMASTSGWVQLSLGMESIPSVHGFPASRRYALSIVSVRPLGRELE